MSTLPSQPDDFATDDLVAYLDGELPPEESRRVEKRLATDDALRHELGELDKAWSALEALPQPAVDEKFTRTTIEMVTVAAKRDLIEKKVAVESHEHRRKWWQAAAGLALATAVFFVVRHLVPVENDALLADLPVVAQVDVLRQVDDLEFLRSLASQDVEMLSRDDDSAAGYTAQDITAARWDTRKGRRDWVDQLPAEKRAELASKWGQFRSLTPQEAAQDRLRRLENDIATAPDRVKLQDTLAAYANWLSRQTPGTRLELRDPTLSTEKRLELVSETIEKENRAAGRPLSAEDETALQEAILKFVRDHRQDFLDELRRQGNPDPQRHIARQSTAFVALGIFWREMMNEDRREPLQEQLIAQLSPDAQEHLEGLQANQRRRQLRRWVRDALQPKFGPQELERYFTEKLTNDQREMLLSLPRSEMESRLEGMFVASELGLSPGQWFGGLGSGVIGRDEPGPGGPPRGPDRGPGGPGGPERRFDRRPPEGPPGDFRGGPRDQFRRGPEGPPPGGPPPDGRDGPPPRGPRPQGPPPQGEGPPRDGPI